MTQRHLVAVDLQEVFADPASPWATPGFASIVPTVAALVEAFGDEVTFTRFVAPQRPAGAWREYYVRWPFARQPPDAPLWDLALGPAGTTVTATTFSKWGPELATRVGGATMVLCGVSTDCCVLSTAVAAADAGVRVQVVADACAGADEASHSSTLDILGLYGPLIEIISSASLLGPGAGPG